jgi:hypothetical protein
MPVPPPPRLLRFLGPGIVWLALAQGSSELIFWPGLVAKYGLGFIGLLVPACLLQLPINYHLGAYTLLTGEGIFTGFVRLHRGFAALLWLLMTASFLWFGAFASAGGTSLAALTGFPAGWSARGQTLFWAYLSMAVFFAALLLSRVIYRFVEKFMWGVAIVTTAGLAAACLQPQVLAAAPRFLRGLVVPERPLPQPWDPADATSLLTAVAFAGLGGFWILFYSYWLREKGAGMAAYAGRVTGPITGKSEVVSAEGFTFAGSRADLEHVRGWKRCLIADSSVGVFGNIATTLLTCLLAYALLFPRGLVPEKYQIAVVQAEFFAASWGAAGRAVFLVVAACFLADSWMATLDGVSRIHADFAASFFAGRRRIDYRRVYYLAALALTAVTSVTVLFDEPAILLQLSAVIGMAGTVAICGALLLLNARVLPRLVPRAAVPGRLALAALGVTAAVYGAIAALYAWARFIS